MSEHVNLVEQSSQNTDRRGYHRLQVRSLVYVELGRSNGGLILNISEGGIAVQAAQVIAEDLFPEMRFRLPKSETWIKPTGKVVWQGKSRKEAGIQFLNLSENDRRLIHDWIHSEGLSPIPPTEEDQPKNLQEAPEQTPENIRPSVTSNSNSSELNAMFPSEKTLTSAGGPGTYRTSLPDVRPKTANPKIFRSAGSPGLPPRSSTTHSTKTHSEEIFAASPATNSGSAQLTDQVVSEAAKDTKDSEKQLPAMTPLEILRQTMTPRIERPEARNAAEKPRDKGNPVIAVLNTQFPTETLQHERRPVAPNPIHVDVPTRGYWKPFSGYEIQPEIPSRKRSILTSILCFAAGLGLAFLIMRGSWSLRNVLFQLEHPSIAGSANSAQQSEPSNEPAPPNTAAPSSPSDDSATQQLQASPGDIPAQTVSPSASGDGATPNVSSGSGQGKPESKAAPSGNEAEQHQTQGSDISSSKRQPIDARGLDNTATALQNERTLDAYAQESRKAPMASNNVSPGTVPAQAPQTSGTDKNRMGFPVSQGTTTAAGTVAIRSHFNSVQNAPDSDSSDSTLQIGQLTSIRQPVYPPEAARRRIEGTVRLQAVVAENGVVETVKLLSGPPGLAASAIDAVRDWRYGQTFLDGHPIESIEDVTVEFRLANSTPSPPR